MLKKKSGWVGEWAYTHYISTLLLGPIHQHTYGKELNENDKKIPKDSAIVFICFKDKISSLKSEIISTIPS